MAESSSLRMSVFVDCAGQSLVMRVPYKFAVEMIFNSPECSDKDELKAKMKTAANRSRELTKLLKEKGVRSKGVSEKKE